MTKKIKIPTNIKQASDRLVALDGIATATGWERAAIVYAHTYDAPRGGGPNRNAPNGALTIASFATLKIKGLSKRDTVAHYRNCWKHAIEQDLVGDIGPGDSTVLPDIDFPPVERGTDGYNSVTGARRTIERIVETHGPEIIANTIVENPHIAEEVASTKRGRNAVRAGVRKVAEKAKARSKMPTPDPNAVVPERQPTVLEVQAWITEFDLITADAADVRKALEVFSKMNPYLNSAQRYELGVAVTQVTDAWESVRNFIAMGGVSDASLHLLIDQTKETG